MGTVPLPFGESIWGRIGFNQKVVSAHTLLNSQKTERRKDVSVEELTLLISMSLYIYDFGCLCMRII